MQKGIKFRIYPNKEQKTLIEQTLGCCRLIYNKGLDMRNNALKNTRPVGYNETAAMLTNLKNDANFQFLKVIDSIALQQSLRDLNTAFTNFFKKRADYPVFKCKHDSRQSYRTINQNGGIRISGKYIRLPKLGFVKVRQSMPVGKIHHVTVERTPTGKYFAVLNVEFEPQTKCPEIGSIGIDVGIKSFYSDSNQNVVLNPKYLEKSMRKLKREQRKLSRRQKGSNNRIKQRIKVASIHEKVTNQRTDFLQKQSTMLIRENQTICIEHLQIKNMLRSNHRLARSIASASWGKFFNMLEYKSLWYGNTLIKVHTFYPSSQTCSCCGYRNRKVKNLAIRKWECPECHTVHDRDYNASINILNKGLGIV